MESIYQSAGYQTATFTSPHLLRYNERIHLNGQEVSDETICQAFERIDQARLNHSHKANNKEISLTYFEFASLAALDIFYRAKPDVIILEVECRRLKTSVTRSSPSSMLEGCRPSCQFNHSLRDENRIISNSKNQEL